MSALAGRSALATAEWSGNNLCLHATDCCDACEGSGIVCGHQHAQTPPSERRWLGFSLRTETRVRPSARMFSVVTHRCPARRADWLRPPPSVGQAELRFDCQRRNVSSIFAEGTTGERDDLWKVCLSNTRTLTAKWAYVRRCSEQRKTNTSPPLILASKAIRSAFPLCDISLFKAFCHQFAAITTTKLASLSSAQTYFSSL